MPINNSFDNIWYPGKNYVFTSNTDADRLFELWNRLIKQSGWTNNCVIMNDLYMSRWTIINTYKKGGHLVKFAGDIMVPGDHCNLVATDFIYHHLSPNEKLYLGGVLYSFWYHYEACYCKTYIIWDNSFEYI